MLFTELSVASVHIVKRLTEHEKRKEYDRSTAWHSDTALTEPRDGFGTLLESGHEAVLP